MARPYSLINLLGLALFTIISEPVPLSRRSSCVRSGAGDRNSGPEKRPGTCSMKSFPGPTDAKSGKRRQAADWKPSVRVRLTVWGRRAGFPRFPAVRRRARGAEAVPGRRPPGAAPERFRRRASAPRSPRAALSPAAAWTRRPTTTTTTSSCCGSRGGPPSGPRAP